MMAKIWTNGDTIICLSRKHCGKSRNDSLRSLSPFPQCFQKQSLVLLKQVSMQLRVKRVWLILKMAMNINHLMRPPCICTSRFPLFFYRCDPFSVKTLLNAFTKIINSCQSAQFVQADMV